MLTIYGRWDDDGRTLYGQWGQVILRYADSFEQRMAALVPAPLDHRASRLRVAQEVKPLGGNRQHKLAIPEFRKLRV